MCGLQQWELGEGARKGGVGCGLLRWVRGWAAWGGCRGGEVRRSVADGAAMAWGREVGGSQQWLVVMESS